MGSLSRSKGRAFEQLVARMLTEATGAQWKRRVRQHDGDSDIVTDEPAYARLSIECKHANVLDLPKWWRQALEQAGDGVPVLIYRQTGRAVYVQVDAHHVNGRHWPVAGRYTVTLGWEAAMQWLREMLPATQYSPGVI